VTAKKQNRVVVFVIGMVLMAVLAAGVVAPLAGIEEAPMWEGMEELLVGPTGGSGGCG